MEYTWVRRDLPVLDAVVHRLDDSIEPGELADVTLIASDTGLSETEVAKALKALDGTYLDLHTLMADADFGRWFVDKVTPEARRAVGQWPSADQFVDALVEALDKASECEPDVSKRSRLRQAAEVLGSVGRSVATEIAAKVISGQLGA